jgi:hypothetical protein
MTGADLLPLITTSAGSVALVLGFLLLVVEHHDAPIAQKACVGLLMFAVLATIDEACRCAVSQLALDWRLPMFVVGLTGAWGFRVCGHFRKRRR